jgi:hypothetical protein
MSVYDFNGRVPNDSSYTNINVERINTKNSTSTTNTATIISTRLVNGTSVFRPISVDINSFFGTNIGTFTLSVGKLGIYNIGGVINDSNPKPANAIIGNIPGYRTLQNVEINIILHCPTLSQTIAAKMNIDPLGNVSVDQPLEAMDFCGGDRTITFDEEDPIELGDGEY